METAPSLKMKKRMYRVLLVVCIFFIGLILRLAYIQIIKSPEYSALALEQQTGDSPIAAARGSILDRNGQPLAVSVSSEVISVTPAQIKACVDSGAATYDQIAQGLADALSLNKDDVMAKLTKSSSFEYIKRQVNKTDADKVRSFISANNITGIAINEDISRYYPNGAFLSQVLGFVGVDNQGLDGIESVMDKQLKGTSGRVITAKTANGVALPFDYQQMVEPEDGDNVVLTIDETIQHITENYLQEAYVENKVANGACAIVMDIKTGEILAMATEPNYDPNNYQQLPADQQAAINALPADQQAQATATALDQIRRNKAIVDSYEPGSTFKIFTASMALEENVVSLDDQFYCTGSIQAAGVTIRCWKAGGHGAETFLQGIENSCNPVFVQVGERIGIDNFYKYMQGFGLTTKTGIELPGETSGIFHSKNNFKEINLVTSAFGQSFQVTPIQMITGISGIANNGTLMKPHIIKGLQDANGNTIKTTEPQVVRQIISADTSSTIRMALEKVVSDGTGSNAYVSGYRIAGKTGTSEKLPRGSGKYIASFCGFAPANDPQVACIVILDTPTGGQYYGGVIAAPVVGKILGDTLQYLNVEPQYTAQELATMEAQVPNVQNQSLDAAKSAITTAGFKYKVIGSGNTITKQVPIGDSRVNINSIITIYTDGQTQSQMVKVPDVKGMSVSQATAAMTNAGLNIKLTGAGGTSASGISTAYSQSIAAGTQIEAGTIVSVEFRAPEVDE